MSKTAQLDEVRIERAEAGRIHAFRRTREYTAIHARRISGSFHASIREYLTILANPFYPYTMNILLVYKEADIATYKMLEGLSKLEDFNIYIASPQSYTDKRSMGIVHLWICRSLPRSSTGTLFVPCAKSSRLIGSTLSTHRVVPVYQTLYSPP